MRLKIVSVLATAALLAGCGSNEECVEVHGQGGAVHGPHNFQPGSAADFVHNAGDRIYYSTDRSSVDKAGHQVVHRQAGWLKKYSSKSVTVQGHCDERGSVAYNQALGERRANAHKKALMSHGISDDRIKTISYGKTRPIVLGHNKAAWAKNRVSVAVLDK